MWIFNRLRKILHRHPEPRLARGRKQRLFEPLENRYLLTATITGTSFSDQTDNGLTGDDTLLNNVAVELFLDNNSDGMVDGGDTSQGIQPTNALGVYRFDGLGAGDYLVRQTTPGGHIQRAGADVVAVTVTATDALGQVVSLIDDFSTPTTPVTGQSILVDPMQLTDESAVSATILGVAGERDLRLELTNAGGESTLRANRFTSGILSFASEPTAAAEGEVVWDGADGDGANIDFTGLGGLDLTFGQTADGLQMLVGGDSSAGPTTLRIYTDATNFSEVTIPGTDTGGSPTQLFADDFTNFTVTGGTGADFTSVGAIQLLIQGVNGSDNTFDTFELTGPTFLTADFANFEPLTLGDLVFEDTNDNGVLDGAETGIDGVVVNLLEDTDTSGGLTMGDAQLDTTTTAGGGIYQFTSLFPGEYIVQIDPANFNTGNVLAGFLSSSGNDPAPDPDDDANDDDNGTLVAGSGIVSSAITLLPNTEPTTDGDADTDTNLALDFGVVNEPADLSVTKTVDNGSPNIGDQVTFTVTVSNDGPGDAMNVELGDSLPAGLTYVSDTPSQGTYNDVTGVWTVGSLLNGNNANLQIVASVDTVGTKTNTAQVTASDRLDVDSTPNNDVLAEDDQDEALVTPQVADLSLTKAVDNPTPNVGDQVLFTVTASNDGPNDATNVTIADALPVGTTFVSSNPSQGAYDGGTGVWTVGTIANLANATLEITASVDSIGTKTNTAQVASVDQADIDSTPNNNLAVEDDQDDASVTPQIADLSLNKTVDNSTPNVGDQVLFTVTATNDGPNDATNVTIADALPAGTTFVSSNPSQGAYDSGTGVWTVGTIANLANATLEITASVDTVGTKTNTAQVASLDQIDIDSTPNNNLAAEDDQDDASLTPQVADLSLTKTVDNSTPNLGTQVLFTVTATNDGPDNATNVTIADALPAGTTFVSSNPSQGAYDSGTGVWTVGTIANAANATLEITATVDTAGTKTNTAQIASVDQADIDSTPNNNVAAEDDQDSAVVTPPQVDITVVKSASPDPATTGSDLTYTLLVTNNGPANATGVTVVDTLPAEVTFSSVVTTQGTASESNGVVTANIGNLSVNQAETVNIVVTPNAAAATAGSVTNNVTVTANEVETDPANNTDQINTAVDFIMSRIGGNVYVDADNDGVLDVGEQPIPGAVIRLTGTDARGAAVDITMQTDSTGAYLFDNLNPGMYEVQETQPAGFRDGMDTLGTGAMAVLNDDNFTAIALQDGVDAQAFNFGERVTFSKRLFLASAG